MRTSLYLIGKVLCRTHGSGVGKHGLNLPETRYLEDAANGFCRMYVLTGFIAINGRHERIVSFPMSLARLFTTGQRHLKLGVVSMLERMMNGHLSITSTPTQVRRPCRLEYP